MFNRCWRWRVLLARRSDGTITRSQWGSLQDHLVSCSSCRKLADADLALQAVFSSRTPLLSPDAISAFDDRVVSAVTGGRWRSVNQPSWLARQWQSWKIWQRLQARSRALPLAFLAQIGGGAVCAVAVTSLFLLPSLHPHTSVSAHTAQLRDVQAEAMERANASVPMESLLQTPTPRAAMLWTAPQNGEIRHKASHQTIDAPAPAALPAQSAPSKTDAPEKPVHPRHTALPNTRAFG